MSFVTILPPGCAIRGAKWWDQSELNKDTTAKGGDGGTEGAKSVGGGARGVASEATSADMPAEGGDAFTKELVPFDLLGKLARSKGSSTPDVWLKTLADSAATAWKKRKQACDELAELANGQAMVRVLCHVALLRWCLACCSAR